jgi:hypothetical protein
MSEEKIMSFEAYETIGVGRGPVGLEPMFRENLIGRSVKRKPYGRICRVVDQKPGYVKIHDYGFWTGWITKKTFETKWEVFYT